MKTYGKITIVQTTVSSGREARALAALILANRLGACVQIAPIRSMYRWRGKNESAKETLVSVKTQKNTAAKLAAFIKKHHPYELPEIITINVKADQAYARWVAGETKRLDPMSG